MERPLYYNTNTAAMNLRTTKRYQCPTATPLHYAGIMEGFGVKPSTEIGEDDIRSRQLDDYDKRELWEQSNAEPSSYEL